MDPSQVDQDDGWKGGASAASSKLAIRLDSPDRRAIETSKRAKASDMLKDCVSAIFVCATDLELWPELQYRANLIPAVYGRADLIAALSLHLSKLPQLTKVMEDSLAGNLSHGGFRDFSR